MRNTVPVISFTFDDFPLSALDVGGEILRRHGIAGTYYVSLGLLDREESVGRICSAAHLKAVLVQGHELGCHTFGHCDAWDTEPQLFEQSILKNQRALEAIIPGATFETMSYPLSTTPRPVTKRQTGRRFACCRAGGQRSNIGTVDLNYVYSFFLERSRLRPAGIWDVLEQNRIKKGWLVFTTHDVVDGPTQFGCTPELFEQVVKRALESGAEVLPVSRALSIVCGSAAVTPGGPL
jgi:peptidoglycan/xylan/chitin deacetylase (PgdA/CDA1 family)